MKHHGRIKVEKNERIVAYFSMEIGLDHRIPTYSGGLGVLAGDTIKAFADLHVPVIAVTLVHSKGYFYQKIENGEQKEIPVDWSKDDFLKKTDVVIDIPLKDRTIKVTAWEYICKGCANYEVPVYFLDTNLPENSDYDRKLTDHLYGGDEYYRMLQEIILGIGGVRILEALGYTNLKKYHMNEGHAAFIAFELYNRLKGKVPADELVTEIRKRMVFTTHTPVPAGRDNFPLDVVKNTLPDFPDEHEASIVQDGKLSMIQLALYFSEYINGVAEKHGEISRGMFPEYPIDSITNGVHSVTWTCNSFQELFDKYIPGWRRESFSLRYAIGIPRDEIMEAHEKAKGALIDLLNSRLNAGFDRDIFTLGFARRAAAYKRADLLFKDVNRLVHLSEQVGKIQIVFAGKAHPADQHGKGIIKHINDIAASLKDKIKIVWLENYDMDSAKLLVSGVDLWLNTPIPPWEASGTSGMKAAHNGVPHLSSMDGWWLEGHIENETGWSIGKTASTDSPRNDDQDAAEMYLKLEKKILPLFYHDKSAWVNIMRHCIALNGSFFNTHRMVEQYVVNAYFR
ncbi:MAG: alpha-glucan family phosphorylase [Nanoarchaeota archaeon]|nr:alpha-glucan family phosphorylase [Nanoarchaeota archaeon]